MASGEIPLFLLFFHLPSEVGRQTLSQVLVLTLSILCVWGVTHIRDSGKWGIFLGQHTGPVVSQVSIYHWKPVG